MPAIENCVWKIELLTNENRYIINWNQVLIYGESRTVNRIFKLATTTEDISSSFF